MMDILRRKARGLLFSPQEEYLIAVGRALVDPGANFLGEFREEVKVDPMLGYELTGLQSMSKLEWLAGDVVLGFAQEITLDTRNETARVGHFAVASDIAGMGLGKRMAQGLAALIKDRCGITTIIFTERSRRPEYDLFFGQILKAKLVATTPYNEWEWSGRERQWPDFTLT
ncbi:hypothetical protein SAMN05444507_11129 [Pseudomonas syringae]|uniref:GNAT family N-acetyltransferase n=1 Tax=Pseudomonas syringae TaxID=317 RepID=UPI0008E8F4A8|nr:GNAT family N-acetyltransferase [Pseudomonas syringae]SFI77226.1 hypothetical protein SAMN05444507_11129 [Pseudomonas syringae]